MARVLSSLVLGCCCALLCMLTTPVASASFPAPFPAPTVRALQATTVSAYLRGGSRAYTSNSNSTNATAAPEYAHDDAEYNGDDLSTALADTPAVQTGSGATVTGAQIGSIAATGALAFDVVGGR